MGKLYFDVQDVRAVVRAAQTAAPHLRRPTLDQLLAGGAYTDNFEEIPEGRERVQALTPPSLTLVHDEGIYLMPNAQLDPLPLAYAKGCDPKAGDVWDHCRRLVGGDDFAQALPLEPFARLMDQPGVTSLVLRVNRRSLSVGAV